MTLKQSPQLCPLWNTNVNVFCIRHCFFLLLHGNSSPTLIIVNSNATFCHSLTPTSKCPGFCVKQISVMFLCKNIYQSRGARLWTAKESECVHHSPVQRWAMRLKRTRLLGMEFIALKSISIRGRHGSVKVHVRMLCTVNPGTEGNCSKRSLCPNHRMKLQTLVNIQLEKKKYISTGLYQLPLKSKQSVCSV